MNFSDAFPEMLKRPTPLMRRFRQLLDEATGGPLENLARLREMRGPGAMAVPAE